MSLGEDPSRLIEEATLADLIRRGLFTPPRLQDKRPPPRLPVMSVNTLFDDIAKDRGER